MPDHLTVGRLRSIAHRLRWFVALIALVPVALIALFQWIHTRGQGTYAGIPQARDWSPRRKGGNPIMVEVVASVAEINRR